MPGWLRFALVIVLALGLAGCAAVPAPNPTYYRVSPGLPKAQGPGEFLSLTLAVPPLGSAESLNRNEILTRVSALTLRRSLDRLWEIPPAQLVSEYLTLAFKLSGAFKAVSTARLDSGSDLVLKGAVTRFEEVLTPSGASAEVAVLVELWAVAARETVFATEFRHSVPFSPDSPDALAQAAGRALGLCLEDIFRKILAEARIYAQRRPGRP